jgi:hypothetical protein
VNSRFEITIEPVCGTPKWENGARRPAPETRPSAMHLPDMTPYFQFPQLPEKFRRGFRKPDMPLRPSGASLNTSSR